MSIRLNKFLADRGVASRRASDRLIEEGRVRINGRVVTDLGTKVEEQRDKVSVDGKPVGGRERHVYFVLNKPVGVITTLSDPEGRRTVKSLLPRGARVYPVGRLDADTSGLLLLTNDGELAHKLMHPRYGVSKVYRVRLAREPRSDQLRRLSSGVRFDKGLVSGPARARRIDPGFDAIMIELVVHEGRFRQVRKMCEAVGLEVTGLHRVGYGPIRLGPLARGMFRELSAEELAKLRAESARAGRSSSGAGDTPARADAASARPRPEARPTTSTPAAHDEDEDDGEDEIEETWLPGGGFLEPEEEGGSERPSPAAERGGRSARRRPSEWPARAGERRGDDDFRPEDSRPRRTSHGEGPHRDGPRRERPRREGPRREGPRREGSRRDGPRADGPRREGPRGESARRDRPSGRGGPRGHVPEGRGDRPRGRFVDGRSQGRPSGRFAESSGRRKPRGRFAESRVGSGQGRARTRNSSRRKPR